MAILVSNFQFQLTVAIRRLFPYVTLFSSFSIMFLQFRETYFRSYNLRSSDQRAFSTAQMKKQHFACDKQELGEIGKAILVTAF